MYSLTYTSEKRGEEIRIRVEIVGIRIFSRGNGLKKVTSFPHETDIIFNPCKAALCLFCLYESTIIFQKISSFCRVRFTSESGPCLPLRCRHGPDSKPAIFSSLPKEG